MRWKKNGKMNEERHGMTNEQNSRIKLWDNKMKKLNNELKNNSITKMNTLRDN